MTYHYKKLFIENGFRFVFYCSNASGPNSNTSGIILESPGMALPSYPAHEKWQKAYTKAVDVYERWVWEVYALGEIKEHFGYGTGDLSDDELYRLGLSVIKHPEFLEPHNVQVIQDKLAPQNRKAKDTSTSKSPGYVYLIQSSDGYWKIGRTIDPDDRMRTFNVKLPFGVEYKHLIPCDDYYAAEKLLHDRYDHRRVNGEWFSLTESDVREIYQIERL